MTEDEYITVRESINYGMYVGWSVDLKQCIPCILLHAEMQISEKMFKLIIYDLYKIHNCSRPSDRKKVNDKINTLMNKKIWGTPFTEAQ